MSHRKLLFKMKILISLWSTQLYLGLPGPSISVDFSLFSPVTAFTHYCSLAALLIAIENRQECFQLGRCDDQLL